MGLPVFRIYIHSLITIALLCIILSICSCDSLNNSDSSVTVPSDFLPQQGDIEGWEKGTGLGDYMEASDQSSLYDIINGGAEIYITHGFTEGVQQRYYGNVLGNERILTLFIADMGDSSGAYNLFHDFAITPTSYSPKDFGDEGRLDEGLLFDYVLDFRLERYYAELTLRKEGTEVESLQILELFALTVESNIEE